MPTQHTLIVSDVHLWQGLPDGPARWMRYRQRRFFPDADLAALLDAARARLAPGDRLALVLNGDVLDLDVPPVVGDRLRFGPSYPDDESGAVAHVRAILGEHPALLEALAALALAGHDVVVVAGNHDAALAAFASVRAAVLAAVARAAAKLLGTGPVAALDAVAPRMRFRAWFHRTADGVHVEHGNQYDAHNAFETPGAPYDLGVATDRVAPTAGALVVRELVGRMGYFNPNHDPSFLLGPAGMLRHWARYYAWDPRRWLALGWARGLLAVVRARARQSAAERAALAGRFARVEAAAARAARETGADRDDARTHAVALVEPALDAVELARDLGAWRAAYAAAVLASVATTLALLASWPLRLLVTAAAAASYRFLHAVVGGFGLDGSDDPLRRARDGARSAARAVLRLHRARAVVFGHTHAPYAERSAHDGAFAGNCGAWAPRFDDGTACEVPADGGLRPVVWLRTPGFVTDDGGVVPEEAAAEPIRGGLAWFHPPTGTFVAAPDEFDTW
jgi:UDP-2,3-diacylglucosamine pyrophosphatase LpxH